MACGSFCASVCHPHLSLCISACLARWRSRDWWGPACQVCGLLSLIRYNSRGNPGSTQTSSAAAWSSFLSPPVTATLHIKISTIPLLEFQRIQHTDWWERMRTKKKSSCCDKCPKACVCAAEHTSKGHSVVYKSRWKWKWRHTGTTASSLNSRVPKGRKKPQPLRLCFLFKEFF